MTVSRRALLTAGCGYAAAALLGGCTRGGTQGPSSASTTPAPGGPEVTTSFEEVDALLKRVEDAFRAADTEAFLRLVPEGDREVWRRIHRGVHAYPMASLGLNRQAQGLYGDVMRGQGRLAFNAVGTVSHQITGVDAAPVPQQTMIGLAKDGPGKELRLDSLKVGTGQPCHPWELSDIVVLPRDHVVLQCRPQERAALEKMAATVDAGVARAYRSIPGHAAQPRLSMLWGWQDAMTSRDGRHIYSDSALISRAGVTFSVETADLGHPSERVLLMMPPDLTGQEARLEQIIAHEATHAILGAFGRGQTGYAFLEEGYAQFIELLDQPTEPPRLRDLAASVDEAVAKQFWPNMSFQEGPHAQVVVHYNLAWSFYVWVERTRGRAAVHELAKAIHQVVRGDDATRKVLGTDVKGSIGAWAAWMKAQ